MKRLLAPASDSESSSCFLSTVNFVSHSASSALVSRSLCFPCQIVVVVVVVVVVVFSTSWRRRRQHSPLVLSPPTPPPRSPASPHPPYVAVRSEVFLSRWPSQLLTASARRCRQRPAPVRLLFPRPAPHAPPPSRPLNELPPSATLPAAVCQPSAPAL